MHRRPQAGNRGYIRISEPEVGYCRAKSTRHLRPTTTHQCGLHDSEKAARRRSKLQGMGIGDIGRRARGAAGGQRMPSGLCTNSSQPAYAHRCATGDGPESKVGLWGLWGRGGAWCRWVYALGACGNSPTHGLLIELTSLSQSGCPPSDVGIREKTAVSG